MLCRTPLGQPVTGPDACLHVVYLLKFDARQLVMLQFVKVSVDEDADGLHTTSVNKVMRLI